MLSASKAKIKSAPRILILLSVAAVFAVLLALSLQGEQNSMIIGQGQLKYEVARTASQRAAGLSNRISLPEDSAMLFEFPSSDYYGIWMKDMKFSIDIVWLDETLRVIHIEENVSPNSYPEIFRPNLPAKYVIETNSGWLAEHDVKVGSVAKF